MTEDSEGGLAAEEGVQHAHAGLLHVRQLLQELAVTESLQGVGHLGHTDPDEVGDLGSVIQVVLQEVGKLCCPLKQAENAVIDMSSNVGSCSATPIA